MSPDLKRLCEAAVKAGDTLEIDYQAGYAPTEDPAGWEAIVRAVLMELREVSGETNGYREGLWSRRNIDAMVQDLLSEPTEA